MLSCLLGPFLIDTFGENLTKLLIGVITFAVIIVYCLYKNGQTSQESNRLVNKESSSRIHLLLGAIIALTMAPFGFAGMLEFRHGREISPILAGSLCLGGGLFLLYSWLNRK